MKSFEVYLPAVEPRHRQYVEAQAEYEFQKQENNKTIFSPRILFS